MNHIHKSFILIFIFIFISNVNGRSKYSNNIGRLSFGLKENSTNVQDTTYSENTDLDNSQDTTSAVIKDTTYTDSIMAKTNLGFNFGAAASVGLLSGETFSNVPTGATVVITTPLGFKLGPFDYTVSFGFGGYTGKFNDTSFNPTFVGIGGNLTIAKFVFAEGHVGLVGEGTGFRGFAGITLERLMKKGFNLPFNLLIGSEAFISNDMAGAGNASGWASLGVRMDYNF